ncbi:MAG: aminodeoxychorismate synthase, component I [Alphaproteobacteria bacterium 64-11]|nr:aminodeoxychorismate synthase component I [Alphaproteobacteria bacterium]OJU09879.1 MAG: aminodeoxychorismate synthase, component I [Alphaproteobacteria bacterium 64-11]
MHVILDFGRRLAFRRPLQVISAVHAGEVPAALEALQQALAAGRHVAGWLGYELGYALEGRLAPRMPPGADPLLKLGVFAGPEQGFHPPPGRAWCGPLRPEWDAAAYGTRFRAVKDYIAAGDIYQANLSFRARFGFLGDPLGLYESLRAASSAPWCGYADDGGRQVISLSPELFFAATPDGTLAARPMKGTLARGADDAAERAALAASEKNRAENLMIVDLIRNDLGRVAEVGSVAVTDLFALETYPTLHTMVSTVTARKRGPCGPADILRALFPCGSVTGAPKIRAMEVLRELETSPRGAYCGALGYFAPDGSAQFNVSIRTLTITGGHESQKWGELGIGGGVVQDSREDEEYAECLLKARFFAAARRPLGLIETLKWDGVFVRLDAHLARMAASAGVFDLPFDDAMARAVLNEAVRGREGPQRVRLALDEAGRHAATAHVLDASPPHWTFVLSPERLDSRDLLLRHKTDWREVYEAENPGVDETVFCNERGEVCEGARSNIFIERDGVLLTPPLSCGLLAGVLRAELIAEGRAREAVLMPDDLKGDVWFGNSLRGLIKGSRV